MNHLNWLRTGGYVAIQLAGIAPMIALLRWGSGSFGLPFASAVILCLGWGSALFALAAPALSAHAWSMGFVDFARRSVVALVVSGALAFLALTLPVTAQWIAGQADATLAALSVFVALGVLRGLAQTATTYVIRADRHSALLIAQTVGRALEIALVASACLMGDPSLLAIGLAAYPLAQSVTLLGGSATRIGSTGEDCRTSFGSFFSNASVQVAEIVVPAVWLALGGPQVFALYRIASAAVSNTAMLPRYWYVVAGTNAQSSSVLAGCLAACVAIFACWTLGWMSAVPDPSALAWSTIPVAAGAFAAIGFSRLRQASLNAGDTVAPAVATLGGRLAELGALGIASVVPIAAGGWMILAAIAQPSSAYLLRKAKS